MEELGIGAAFGQPRHMSLAGRMNGTDVRFTVAIHLQIIRDMPAVGAVT